MNRMIIIMKKLLKSAVFALALFASSMPSLGYASAQPEVTDANPIKQPEAYQQRLVDWIRSTSGGYFHPAIEWRRLGPDGKSGIYAMHATQDIPKDTTLLVLPRSLIIDSRGTDDECVTIERMLEEREKGDDSKYAPYLSYLFDDTVGGTSRGLLPTAWSSEGQQLLSLITDKQLEPKYFHHRSAFKGCGKRFVGTVSDPKYDRQLTEDAYLYWLSRSWTDKMCPVLDMFNHRNGKWLNIESTSAHELDEDITAYALRDIRAGEQLQNSYSECLDEDCEFGGIKYSYLTPHILKDYGFVELYPRRWILGDEEDSEDEDSGDYDSGDGADDELQWIVAEVDVDPDTDEKIFKWIFETPTTTTVKWITEQLKRLTSIEDELRDGVKKLESEHEKDTLLEYFEGYVEVLKLALMHQDDEVSVTEEQFHEELEHMRSEL